MNENISSPAKRQIDLPLFRESFDILKKHEPLILAGATSFFATFSLSPIVVILINVLGLYYTNDEIKNQLISKLEGMFGPETSRSIESIVVNVNSQKHNWLIAIFSFLFLLFIATTLLKIVRQAIHNIWNIQRKDVNKLKYNLKERSIGIFILLITGVLVGISIIADTTVALLQPYLKNQLPDLQLWLIRSLNVIFSVAISTVWFSLLFKVLPDARVHWRVAFAGGLLTSLLFTFGKWILGKFFIYNLLSPIFGPSASFVLILLFIFYSSLILYFGASFTYAFAVRLNRPIHAGKSSEQFEVRALGEEPKPQE